MSIARAFVNRPLILLADADAFRSIGLARREALWIVRGLRRASGVRLGNMWCPNERGEANTANNRRPAAPHSGQVRDAIFHRA